MRARVDSRAGKTLGFWGVDMDSAGHYSRGMESPRNLNQIFGKLFKRTGDKAERAPEKNPSPAPAAAKQMDLGDFIRDALLDIIRGIRQAQVDSRHGAIINPPLKMVFQKNEHGAADDRLDMDNLRSASLIATHYQGHADIINFDLAITVESSSAEATESTKAAGGGLKIHVVSAGVDVAGKKLRDEKTTQSNVSRIQFRVPVQFPTGR